jgi:hypothetical protein
MNAETFFKYFKKAVPIFAFYNTVGNELLNLSFYISADKGVLSNTHTVNAFHHHVLVKHNIMKLALLLPSGESMKHTLGIGISSIYGPDRVSSFIVPDGRSRASFQNFTFVSSNETVERVHCMCHVDCYLCLHI